MKSTIAVLLLCASFVQAQEPEKLGPFDVEAYTWTQLVYGRGMKHPTHLFGARAEGMFNAGFLTCGTRLDASATKDGVVIENPETWNTVESYTYCTVRVLRLQFGDLNFGSASLVGIWGETLPQWGQEGESQRTRMVGLGLGGRDTWVLLGFGDHESVGQGRRFIAAWKIRVEGQGYLVGDFAAGDNMILGTNWRIRGGIAVKVLK